MIPLDYTLRTSYLPYVRYCGCAAWQVNMEEKQTESETENK